MAECPCIHCLQINKYNPTNGFAVQKGVLPKQRVSSALGLATFLRRFTTQLRFRFQPIAMLSNINIYSVTVLIKYLVYD